jgi:hypothetical protein
VHLIIFFILTGGIVQSCRSLGNLIVWRFLETPPQTCQRLRPISHYSTVGSTRILDMLCVPIGTTFWPERSFIFESTREILPFEDFWTNHSGNSQSRRPIAPFSTVGSIWILDMWCVWWYYTFWTVEIRWNPSSKVLCTFNSGSSISGQFRSISDLGRSNR